MQSDPGNDELVEKMARAIYEAWCEVHKVSDTSMPWEEIDAEEREACFFEALAALSVARPAIKEECARVAEKGKDSDPIDDFDTGWNAGLCDAAAAIRAME
jgi:hypothetical protein